MDPEIRIIESPTPIAELRQIAATGFGDMVKIVVDVEKGVLAAGGELHADEEAWLLDRGSQQQDLWGANIYVNEPRESRIEFDSMINLRPSQGNLSRSVRDQDTRNKILGIVNKLVQ